MSDHDDEKSFSEADVIAALSQLSGELRPNQGEWSKLHQAASDNNVRELRNLLRTDERIFLESRNDWGRTPLHLAASKNSVDTTLLLLENGAQKDAVDKNGSTPMHAAIAMGNFDILSILLVAHADANASDKYEFSGFLIDTRRYGNTGLMRAAMGGKLEMCTLLLQHGAQMDVVNSWGDTALHYAGQYGHVDTVKLLIRSGAQHSIRNNKGKSAHEVANDETRELIPIAPPPRAILVKVWKNVGLPVMRASAAGFIVFMIIRLVRWYYQ